MVHLFTKPVDLGIWPLHLKAAAHCTVGKEKKSRIDFTKCVRAAVAARPTKLPTPRKVKKAMQPSRSIPHKIDAIFTRTISKWPLKNQPPRAVLINLLKSRSR